MTLIQEGGAPVYGLLCCALFTHPLALVALAMTFARGRGRGAVATVGGASLAVGVGAIAVGVGGYLYGMQQVEAALMFADPEHHTQLYAYGRSDAMISLWVGLASSVIPVLAGAGALVRGFTLPAPREAGGR